MVIALAVVALTGLWGTATTIALVVEPPQAWLPVIAAFLVSGGVASGASQLMRLLARSERDARGPALRVRARTAALVIARRHAEERMTEQTRFLASMSHELRTPLNAIIGFSEALASGVFGPLADRHAEYVTDIHHSGVHLLALVNDMLDIAATDAGKTILEETKVDLVALIDEAEHMLGPRATKADISIERPLALPSVTLLVDRRRLLQALLNVIGNAIKYTRPAGWVQISAVLHPEGPCVIMVADNGIGMSPDELEIALAPFGRASNTETRGIEGTGLGLPLAIRLIEAHGGSLSLDSIRGVGTTVSMALPSSRVQR